MDKEIIANIKSLGIDMIREASSGHSGIVLSAAPILYTLFAKHICISTSDDTWMNRDRFILSAGHGSALLYATLFYAGFDLTMEDLKQFRQFHSKTPGHPEYGKTPGVDLSTGALGEGIASAVGMAISEEYLRSKLSIPRQNILMEERSLINHYIYVLCGDGDLMEGISYEACSLAGSLELSHLIVLYDSNHMSLDGETKFVFNENIRARFEAMGWDTELVKNGEDIDAIDKAINRAKRNHKPTLIEIRTILGNGSLLANSNLVHGIPLTDEDVEQLKRELHIPNVPFLVNEEARQIFRRQITERSNERYEKWANDYRDFMSGTLLPNWEDYLFLFQNSDTFSSNSLHIDLKPEQKENLRTINQWVINEIAKKMPNFIGGTADLASSTQVKLLNEESFTREHKGRNLCFGVREHAMGAIVNGLALYRFRPFCSTYLSFADYMKPAIRMACLMNLPIIYIFTHDSILVGEDGPTHQPVEQLSMLRELPNMNVFRPADGHELIGCWQQILNRKNPSSLILSRNETRLLNVTKVNEVKYGAYIVRKEQEKLNGIIIATGSEVYTALHLAYDLYQNYKMDLRVVSMPCCKLFLETAKEYQEMILPKGYKKFVIEAASNGAWYQFVYNDSYLFTINQFGASGKKEDVLRACHFDYETIKKRMLKLL